MHHRTVDDADVEHERPVEHEHAVERERPVEQREREQVVTSSWFIDLSRIVSLLAGLFLVLLGTLVLIDTGLHDFPASPTTEVWGFTQTPLLGVIDLGAGVLLLLGAIDPTRGLSILVGALTAMGGVIMLAAGDKLDESLQANDAYGWMAVILGGVVLLVALFAPSRRGRRMTYRGDAVPVA
jgi:hypothetical protein